MRKARQLQPGATYHVTARINNKEKKIRGDSIKNLFLEILIALQEEMGFGIENFTVMDNHIHLIVKTLDLELPKIMQRLLMTFTIRYNKRRGRTGHLWGDRYHSRILEGRSDIELCSEYINNNAVRAKLVKSPEKWKWSGISFYNKYKNLMESWISSWMHPNYQHAIARLKENLHGDRPLASKGASAYTYTHENTT